MRDGFAGSMPSAHSSEMPIGINTTSSSSRRRALRNLHRPSIKSMLDAPTADGQVPAVFHVPNVTSDTLDVWDDAREPRDSSGSGEARTHVYQMMFGPFARAMPSCLRGTGTLAD